MNISLFTFLILVLQFKTAFLSPQIYFEDSVIQSGNRGGGIRTIYRRPSPPPPLPQNFNTNLDATQITGTENVNNLRELCPNLAENLVRFYRYDRNTRKCYRGGDQGPCGKNMIFYSEEDNRVYGVCDCDYKNHERELIYHPGTKQCHFVYSRGYCSAGKWLVFNVQMKPTCTTNTCHSKRGGPSLEFVPFQGTCVLLGSENESCEQGKVVGFVRGELLPTCAVPESPSFTTLTVGVPKLSCTPGSTMGIFGRCKRKYTLKLN